MDHQFFKGPKKISDWNTKLWKRVFNTLIHRSFNGNIPTVVKMRGSLPCGDVSLVRYKIYLYLIKCSIMMMPMHLNEGRGSNS